VRAQAAVVIPAGGAGTRMGGVRKAFLVVGGAPLLRHTLTPFLATAAVKWIVIALATEDAESPPEWLRGLDARVRIVSGGEERGDSVRNALAAVPEAAAVVLVHDAARPLVTERLVRRCIAAATQGRCVVPALPVTDTVQQVDADGYIVATPDRGTLRAAQTPQAFPRAVLVDAYRRAAEDGVRATDDAGLVARYGTRVQIIEGESDNIKVTTWDDVTRAEALLARAHGRLWTPTKEEARG
jgi:2-C-methyl-D-erythritol 4-phosphate cytidylyltransferase